MKTHPDLGERCVSAHPHFSVRRRLSPARGNVRPGEDHDDSRHASCAEEKSRFGGANNDHMMDRLRRRVMPSDLAVILRPRLRIVRESGNQLTRE